MDVASHVTHLFHANFLDEIASRLLVYYLGIMNSIIGIKENINRLTKIYLGTLDGFDPKV